MAGAGRKLSSMLNAQFRLDSEDMLDDAKKYRRSYSYGDEREQDEDEAESDGFTRDKRTGYITVTDTRMPELRDEDEDDNSIDRQVEEKTKRRSEVRPRRRRTPSDKSESSDEKDFNDFLDNYDEYKEQGYYPNVILGKRRRTKNITPLKQHSKNCKRYGSSSREPSLIISDIDSSSVKYDCYQPSIGSTTPSIRSMDSPSEYFTADESNSENASIASSRRNGEPRNSSDKPKATYGWLTSGDGSHPKGNRTPVCSTPQSKSTNGPATCGTPSSLSQIGWKYKNQSTLSPNDITVDKKKSSKIDPDSEPDKSEVKRSTFSKFKCRLSSVFN